MAVETRTQLKTYFQTGDVPTESQFATLIDSAMHVNDQIRVVTITANSTFTVPVGKTMLWIGVYCTANQTGVKIGTTGAGSDDIMFSQNVTNGQEIPISCNVWARNSAKTIYVTGTALTLYIREVTSAPLT